VGNTRYISYYLVLTRRHGPEPNFRAMQDRSPSSIEDDVDKSESHPSILRLDDELMEFPGNC
jgi:hypothetical protein